MLLVSAGIVIGGVVIVLIPVSGIDSSIHKSPPFVVARYDSILCEPCILAIGGRVVAIETEVDAGREDGFLRQLLAP